ncbi:5'-nucleotidase [Agrococcus baldri]|uniref:5'-nucleotidase n=1 Tax=Agrococcus baldri TaxID=153730 RepID=A0AA94KYX6_9MICO|nr:cell wall-binding repeat-containing protein [Agrococcus baldri]SFS03591.1 5'-nucleotidase [Agrococcus baldri]
MKHFKRNTAVGAACALGLGLMVAPQAAVAAPIDPATTAVVNLIHINDFHGRVESPLTVNFAGVVEDLRAAYPTGSLLTGGGDLIGASNFTSGSQDDVPTIDVLNALGLDASTVGNHEFDRGVADLTDRVMPLADWTYLSANVTLDGAPIGPAYATYEIDGMTVGVVGAVTEETASLVSPGGIVGVEFAPVAETINRVAAELSDGDASNGEADIVVAELHDHGLAYDTEFSANVDVVFNGHTHQAYAELRPVPGEAGVMRPFVQSGEYAGHVGHVVLEVNRSTGVITPTTVENVATPDVDGSAYIAKYPRVAEIATIVDAAEDAAAVAGNVQVGTISADITVPLQDRGNRAEESTMGELVANMYRDQVAPESRGGAEIGVVNPGGLRDNLLFAASEEETADGIVRLAEANAVLPFINNLGSVTLTGAQLDEMLEQQWQRNADGSTAGISRPYLQLGISDNVTYISDPSRALNDRVSDVRIDGVPVTAEQEIRVATASFLLDGGDNFWVFPEGADRRDSGLVDLDAFTAYLADNPGIGPDWTVNHMDVTGLPVAAEKGGEVTIQVSQIDRIRSTGAVPSTTLEVLNGAGEVVGSGDVVVTNDAQGAPLRSSAEVTFIADAAEAGLATFTLRADNGTEIPFQLEVLPTDRIAGENRFLTAVEISKDVYPEGAPVVYVASGEVWPDALTAGPAAAHEGGPLLLVRKGEAPAVVLDEIARLGAERVVIVGDQPSVSAEVETAIDAIATVTTTDRVAGQNRFETSRLVAEYAFETAGGAYVATGLRFPDALSAGAAAGHLAWPLVLVDTRTEIPAATIATLDALGVQNVRVAGSADAVPSSNAGDLVDAGYSVARQGGANRFITSAIVTLGAFDAAPSGAYLATGQLFPDALAGGAAAGAQGAPLLITREGCVPQPVLDALDALAPTSITLLGGEPSLSLNTARLISCG